MASGALRLTGKPTARSTGNKPMAITHCARVQACHGRHAPRRALKQNTSVATAPNDSQKPGSSAASGSTSNTATSASNSGRNAPRCRKRNRHSNTTASIRQARCTGTPAPASQP